MQFLDQLCRPDVQLFSAGVFERILVLRAADAILDRQILDRLHIERDALHLGQFRLQPSHDFGGADSSFAQWLEIDQNPAAVECRVDAVHADER